MKTKGQISFAVSFAVTAAKLIGDFVFPRWIVQFLYFLYIQKFPASSHLLCLYSSVFVRPDGKLHCWFSHDTAQICLKFTRLKSYISCVATLQLINKFILTLNLCMRKPIIWVLTRSDINQPVQSQKQARSLKFRILRTRRIILSMQRKQRR